MLDVKITIGTGVVERDDVGEELPGIVMTVEPDPPPTDPGGTEGRLDGGVDDGGRVDGGGEEGGRVDGMMVLFPEGVTTVEFGGTGVEVRLAVMV